MGVKHMTSLPCAAAPTSTRQPVPKIEARLACKLAGCCHKTAANFPHGIRVSGIRDRGSCSQGSASYRSVRPLHCVMYSTHPTREWRAGENPRTRARAASSAARCCCCGGRSRRRRRHPADARELGSSRNNAAAHDNNAAAHGSAGTEASTRQLRSFVRSQPEPEPEPEPEPQPEPEPEPDSEPDS